MKKFCILLIALHMVSGASAQSCLPEGIIFTTQAQIDSFQVNYPGCTEIEGNVTIQGNDITILDGLSSLTSIGGDLVISGNNSLTSIEGLNNLDTIFGGFYISSNPLLNNLTGLDNLTFIQNDFNFGWLLQPGGCVGNPAISDFRGLSSLNSIGGSLNIVCSDILTSLMGLEGLITIGGGFSIFYNDALTNFTGLDGLTSIGGVFHIYQNNVLTSFTGLDSLDSIGGGVKIIINIALISFTGLEGLTSIGGELQIWGNYVLENLTGLGGLTSIGGSLTIGSNNYGNIALTSLTGLENIYAGSITNLTIRSNYLLTTCEIHSVCDYLATPNGIIVIQDNATGCNSSEEVITACEVGVEESAVTSQQSAVNIYPNPSSSSIIISTPTTPNKNTFLTIYNINGQRLIECQITEQQTVVDVSGLPQGVYFVRIADDKTVMVTKFIKQ